MEPTTPSEPETSSILLDQYASERPLYVEFAKRLEFLLSELLKQQHLKPHAITSRAKEVESLRAKLSLKRYKALSEITDLTGVRVVLYFQDDVDKVLQILAAEFQIDYVNTVDKREHPNPFEFGYRSFHYIVSLRQDRIFLTEYRQFAEMKAEIQVRSILDHAWAEIQHGGLGYKAERVVPRRTQRALAKAAALLEVADGYFVEARKAAAVEAQPLPRLRVEGLSELVPVFDISIPTALLMEAKRSYDSLAVYFSTNVTSTKNADGLLRSVRLISNNASCTGPIRGVLLSCNGVLFPKSMPQHIATNVRAVQFTVSGVRIDTAWVGAGSAESAHLAACCVVACSQDGQKVSEVLVAQHVAAVCHAFSFSVRRVCPTNEEHHDANALSPIGILSFRELFPQALRSSIQESLDPLDPCSSGTRLVVRLHDVPQDLDLFVDAESRGIQARLMRSDSNGAGEFNPVTTTEKYHDRDIAAITTTGGASMLVWEVQENASESAMADITMYARTSQNLPGELSIAGGLGPTSTINTSADGRVPIPRFVNDPQPAVLTLGGF